MNAATIPTVFSARVVRDRVCLHVVAVIAASLFIAAAAQIAIPVPYSPVPLTLQPLAVLLVGVVLGSRRGAAAAALYLFEGFAGLPVFAQGHGGFAWMIAATAGYLYAFPAAAFVAGWFSERGWGTTTLRAVCGMTVAMSVIYIGGWSWLAILVGPARAMHVGVAPFLIADLIKVALGAMLLPQLQKFVTR